MDKKEETIKFREEVINGKKVKVQIIPFGMSGVSHPVDLTDFEDEEESPKYAKILNSKELSREYFDYLDEGIEPDADEIRDIKESVERKYRAGLFDETDPLELDLL